MSYLFNNQVQVKGTDAFSRIRVSEGFTLAEYNHVYGDGPEMLIIASGSATASSVANQASRRLSVGTQSGTYIIEQSRMYHHYVPGKSQYILSSFVFGTYSAGASKNVVILMIIMEYILIKMVQVIYHLYKDHM